MSPLTVFLIQSQRSADIFELAPLGATAEEED